MVIFNDRIAEVAERYLKKGAKIYVEGALQTRKWTDQSGQEKYTTEVVIGRFRGELTMLDGRGEGGGMGEGGGGYAPRERCDRRRPPRQERASRPAQSGGGTVLGRAARRRPGRRDPVLGARAWRSRDDSGAPKRSMLELRGQSALPTAG